MKKTLLLGLMLLGSLTAKAQLADGTAAPDFTATDINGQTHSLSGYLDDGKTVILYISATWCGPCWQFHGTHYLADLYNAYGPEGSDELVVLYIEGDNATTLADIQGTGPNTWGDWTEGSPYPIIDNAAIADDYAIQAFPTLYMICPNSQTTMEIDRNDPAGFVETISEECGVLTGVASRAELRASDKRLCGSTGQATATILNLGTSDITTASLVLKENGNVVATQDYVAEEGEEITQFGSDNVIFEDYEFDPEADYTIEIAQFNDVTETDDELAVKEINLVHNAADDNLSGINIRVEVHTDFYPSETSFNIYDSQGNVVGSGGPYEAGNADQFGGGGPDANTMKVHNFLLPEEVDCYSIEILDEFGDGLVYGPNGQANSNLWYGVKIFSSSINVLDARLGGFGSRVYGETIFKTTGELDNASFETNKFAVYPNPTTGILNFTTEETVSISVLDITGKVVFNAENINNGDSINLNSLQAGMYIAQIKGETTEKVEKIIIK